MEMIMGLYGESRLTPRGDPYSREAGMPLKKKYKNKKPPILVRLLSGYRDKMLRSEKVRTK